MSRPHSVVSRIPKVEPFQAYRFTCPRCGHDWFPEDLISKPRGCPRCKLTFEYTGDLIV